MTADIFAGTAHHPWQAFDEQEHNFLLCTVILIVSCARAVTKTQENVKVM
uniref:Uncharacterized protein n=1 Tax=Faecalibaculum rodentium TaxID=1702221 RepID=A0A140DY18_9FIRM|nr:hypothetical protein AALO17_24110 [Faecalibaculum rodentium]